MPKESPKIENALDDLDAECPRRENVEVIVGGSLG